MLKSSPDRYKTQKMCDKAVDSFLLALKLVPDWSVMSKMIEKLDNTVFFNDDIIFGGIDSDIVKFFSNDIGLNRINLNNVNLDDNNFVNCSLETINHVRLMAWYNRYNQYKACQKRQIKN